MNRNEEIKKDIEERLEDRQNEYFGLITGFQKDGTPIDDEWNETKYIYKWERMKELQKEIIHLCNSNRERSIMICKEQLERAFTPRLKSMLSKKLQHEIDENDNG